MAAPSLEILHYLTTVASEASPAARGLLSTGASGLLGRGWLASVDSLVESTAHTLDFSPEVLRAQVTWLTDRGLLEVQGGRILSLGGLFSTRPTGLTLRLDERHAVDLLGPLAALAAPIALQHHGEMTCFCAQFPESRLRLHCDAQGVRSREPETLCLFLPTWDAGRSPTAAIAGGLWFRDEDALDAWQMAHGDPPGLSLTGLLFAMAATDLGSQLGQAMRPLFDHLPDFD